MINFRANTFLLDEGKDSTVYLMREKNCVMKIYRGLFIQLRPTIYDELFIRTLRKFNFKGCLEMVQKYNVDTFKAAKIIESEWKDVPKEIRTITMDDTQYSMLINILPQGKAGTLYKPFNRSVASIGQKYVPEPNLVNIQHFSYINNINFSTDLQTTVRKTIDCATNIINKQLNLKFEIVDKNIKPILNKSNKTLEFIITDLADDIIKNYKICV